MRRLSLQIYLAFLGVFLVFFVLSSLFWFALGPPPEQRRFFDAVAAVVATLLPEPEAPAAAQEAALLRLAQRFRADLSLYAADGALVAAVGEVVPLPPPRARQLRGFVRRHALVLSLPDGRRLVSAREHEHGLLGLLPLLAAFALAIALGTWPLVRRLTGRLERLRGRVERLGSGDLSARVAVEGRDEVAALAASFNRAAERIEGLVRAQRTLLASASHELRSPLARIGMGIELLAGGARPELRASLERDVEELDDLISELLLASRLELRREPPPAQAVDLLALVAEECARLGLEPDGAPVSVRGDPRMLRRLLRNLLENARRHAAGAPVEVEVAPAGLSARLVVADGGPGVPDAERERIFEPFHRLPGQREGDGGVGLGLFLVREIARRHGGEARCLARAGGGTRFEVELPALAAEPGALHETLHSGPAPETRTA
jgi:signal transduction histidine kinase